MDYGKAVNWQKTDQFQSCDTGCTTTTSLGWWESTFVGVASTIFSASTSAVVHTSLICIYFGRRTHHDVARECQHATCVQACKTSFSCWRTRRLRRVERGNLLWFIPHWVGRRGVCVCVCRAHCIII